MGSRIRTFIAVEVERPVRDRLQAMQERLAAAGTAVNWVGPENLHVTLLFLGEVEFRESPRVCHTVADTCVAFAPFSIEVEGVGCFPNVRRPRVLWAGIGEGREELTALHEALEPPLLALGCYRREERSYTPHVTLGRVKNEGPAELLTRTLARHADWTAGTSRVRQVLIMASDFRHDGPPVRGEGRSGGPRYSILGRAPLSSGQPRHDEEE